MSRVAIIGDGGWGTALALLLYNKGVDVLIWSFSPEYAGILDKKRENVKFLKGFRIPEGIKITSDPSSCAGADYAVFAVPCKYLRSVVSLFEHIAVEKIISATKGIENGTLKRPSEVISDFFQGKPVGVLSGPSISVEVAHGQPAAVVLASKDGFKAEAQRLFSSECFRVYTSSDTIGVELGGAVKNVIAIAAGISDALGFGANAKAAILTRGIREITKLGIALGANEETFMGLSGIGDLATTCMSASSRNRWFGEELGKGRDISGILDGTEMVVEGVNTCSSVMELAGKYSVEMPITRKIYEIIHAKKDPKEAVRELMTRDLKDE